MTTLRKGHLVSVLRNALGDCTNGGVTSKRDTFILLDNPLQRLGGNVHTPQGPHDSLYLAKWYGRIIAVPEDLYQQQLYRDAPYRQDCNVANLGGWMFGGNFVYSSDSRYHELTDYPIPVYDRKE